MKIRGLIVVFFASLAAMTMACERRSGPPQSTTGEIVVGMYGSLTGDGASFGQSSVEGAQLAVEEINTAGGVLGGRKIRLLVEDDQSRPEEASSAVTKLITQDKVVAVLGEVASRRTLAAAPVAQKYQIPMITPASTNERVTQVGDYIFRVCFIDPFQGEVLAKFAYNDLKARKVAVLKDIQQDYSVGLTDSIQKTFTGARRQGARSGQLQLGRRRLPGHPHAGARAEARRDLRHRLLPRGRHHRPPGARARHDDADPRRRRLGRRCAEERPRGAQEHVHLQSLLGRQPRSDRPELP